VATSREAPAGVAPPAPSARALLAHLRFLLAGPGSWWDVAPRPGEAASEYLEGARLHWKLLRGGYSMGSSRRGRALRRLARDVARNGVPGALVDCGSWNGGSTVLLSSGAPDRPVYAFDSFEGLPEPGALDGDDSAGQAGFCLGSEAKVRRAFAGFAPDSDLRIRAGWFEDTFPSAAQEIDQVAVLHCDGDWYDSVLLSLETFYPKVPSGGYVMIDDYGHWIGARRATDEFKQKVGDATPLTRVDYTGHYWRKP
jgi:O-methyltransferase